MGKVKSFSPQESAFFRHDFPMCESFHFGQQKNRYIEHVFVYYLDSQERNVLYVIGQTLSMIVLYYDICSFFRVQSGEYILTKYVKIFKQKSEYLHIFSFQTGKDIAISNYKACLMMWLQFFSYRSTYLVPSVFNYKIRRQ